MLALLRLVLGNTWGQLVAMLLALYAWFQFEQNRQFQKGVQAGEKQVAQKSIEQGKKNAAQSKKEHDAARKPGAFERLRADPLVCPRCSSTVRKLETPNH